MGYIAKKYLFCQPSERWPRIAGLLFIILTTFSNLNAQNAYTAGTEFMFAYGDVVKNFDFWNASGIVNTSTQNTLILIGVNEACVHVSIKDLNYTQTVIVSRDSVVEVLLPYIPIYSFESVHNYGVQIESNAPVNVVMCVNPHGGKDSILWGQSYAGLTEASAVVPNKNLDNFAIASCMLSPIDASFGISSAIFSTLISLENGNQIEFKLKASAFLGNLAVSLNQITRYTDTTYTIVLQQGEVYNFFTESSSIDPAQNQTFVGSYFRSANGKKINVQTMPGSSYCLDELTITGTIAPLQEQLLPLNFWGTSFHALPLAGSNTNQYTVLASRNNTQLGINGSPIIVLDSLQYFDTCMAGNAVFSTSHASSIYMAGCPTAIYNDNTYSPFSVTLSSDHQLQGRSIFSTIDEPDTINNYVLGVVTPTSGVGQFSLNGVLQNSALFTPFTADSAWSWANIPLQKGQYIAESPVGFHGFHYTWYNDGIPNNGTHYPSYGYVLPESIAWPQDSFAFQAGISPITLAAFNNFNDTLCPGQLLFLQANHLRHTTWYWQFGDGSPTQVQHATENRAPVLSYSWASAGKYWVTVSDSAGCAASDSILVVVGNFIEANFTAIATTSCSGTFVQLQNQSIGATDYNWQWPGGSSTAQNPSFNYTGQDSTITISLIANSQNCADSATQTLNIKPSTFNPAGVPNVITPNNDGINDAFCIAEAAGFSDCFQLQIFNRWGSEVFKTQNPQDCWQAQNAAAGVYFYVLKIGEQQYKGQVTVF